MYMTIDKYQHPFRFYSLSIIIPWICWFVAAYLSHLTPSNSIYISIASLLGIIGLVSPMVIAFSMMLPDPELRSDLFNRLFTFKKIKPIYLLATFFLMLASILLAQGISLLFGYSAEQFNLSHGFSFTAGLFPAWFMLFLAPILEGILGSNTDFYIRLCKGQDTRPVEVESKRQSLGNEITFPQDLADQEEIQQVLLELCCRIGYRIRQSSLMAHTITIKMRTPDFKTLTRSKTLPQGVDADLAIYDIALDLYRNSDIIGSSLRLLGVSAGKLIDRNEEPGTLFYDKNQTLDGIMDDMKKKFGRETIKRGSLLKSKHTNKGNKSETIV
jgi:hypothetical protein